VSNLRAGIRREYNVRDLIDERPLSRFQLLVIALCGLIIVLDGFDSSIGFLAPSIADDLRIPLPKFGRIGSIIGPTLGGILLSLQWEPRQIFLASTLPALAAASSAFLRKNAG
jgi:predicted MFS family arabinose efflux permease